MASKPKGYVEGFRPRMNLRDLGDYLGADGRKLKSGLIYRSAAPGKMLRSERARFSSLGIAHILDLRSSTEAEKLPDPSFPGASYTRISGAMDADDREIDLSPSRIYGILFNPRRVDDDPEENLLSQLAETYSSLAFDNPAYRRLFELLEAGETPLLFHCTNGKDRTGVAAMLILLALGASENDIIADYSLSNHYLEEEIEGKIARHPMLAKLSIFATAIRASEGVLPSFGARVLEEIKQEYGDYGRFLEAEYGLTPNRIEALRERYLEDAPAKGADR